MTEGKHLEQSSWAALSFLALFSEVESYAGFFLQVHREGEQLCELSHTHHRGEAALKEEDTVNFSLEIREDCHLFCKGQKKFKVLYHHGLNWDALSAARSLRTARGRESESLASHPDRPLLVTRTGRRYFRLVLPAVARCLRGCFCGGCGARSAMEHSGPSEGGFGAASGGGGRFRGAGVPR